MIDRIRAFARHRGAMWSLLFVVFFVTTALFAEILAPYSPLQIHEQSLRLPPFWMDGGDSHFLLGTDDLGRDLLSRLIFGARISLSVGLLVVTLTLFFGSLLGLAAGYFGGWMDSLIMRGIDILMSLPSILLAIVVVTILGASLTHTILAVSVVSLPHFVRIVRASVKSEMAKTYVNAAVGFGASHFRVALGNVLPNCLAPIIVQAALGFSDGILNAAALGFLGLGAEPPTPEWGAMLADGRAFMESCWWIVTLPGICLLSVVLSFNLIGDGLRDALDPKLK